MLKKLEKKYSLLDHQLYLLHEILKTNRKLLLFMIMEAICTVITPYVSMYIPKLGVDFVAQKEDIHRTILVIGSFTAIMIVSQALGNMASRGKTMLLNAVRNFYREKLFCTTLDCEYSHVESPEWQDKYEEAKQMSVDWGPWSATTLMLSGMIKLFASIFSFFLYGHIIVSLNLWILVLLIVISAFNFYAMRRAQLHEQSRIDERSQLQRRRSNMLSYASDSRMGKDVRLYDMSGWILQIFNYYRELHYRLRKDVQQHYSYAAFVEAATLFIRDGISYCYLIWATVNGRISLGNFVLISSAIACFSSLITQVSQSFGLMMQAVPPLDRMRAYLDKTDTPEPESAVEIPKRGDGIEIIFQNVTFYYNPGKLILDHLNLTISNGEKLALVGVNGAGKSTLVKLLCGLYHPVEGRILINGTNIRQYKKEDLYSIIAPVFQDAAIFPFTVAENVSLKVIKDTNREKVIKCLNTVGLLKEVEGFEKGIDQMMLHITQKDGAILSGGQLQKLFMARALYKDTPIMIFDEPTASLDPIAESETYEQFDRLSSEKTTIYISHRLASTRFCDRIVLLEDGRVIANGSHKDLLKNCESYAQMYHLQSLYYHKNKEEVV
ncbi:ATP-binding cassette, subfamily B [Anaerocolumna jejuensis DSM 15929]|uniref:ATP-binding cassette, subfamily B n=1 Tax=Anaerocolumna jejuensis DSM 15929 TaxID=1121322 RepID=A0A1M7DLV6_9FIRM|nr:ABC transporter ATP-binding protein [Anaerocolumna jejuensis]SHL80445.1 ATP-binding cassette, subfamily B [Anaerocolumna jejuensis DSM 15929]